MNPNKPFPRSQSRPALRLFAPSPRELYDHEIEQNDAYTESGIDSLLEDDEIDSLEHGFMSGYLSAL